MTVTKYRKVDKASCDQQEGYSKNKSMVECEICSLMLFPLETFTN